MQATLFLKLYLALAVSAVALAIPGLFDDQAAVRQGAQRPFGHRDKTGTVGCPESAWGTETAVFPLSPESGTTGADMPALYASSRRPAQVSRRFTACPGHFGQPPTRRRAASSFARTTPAP